MNNRGPYNTDYTEYRRIFKMFKEEYEELVERGTTFEPYGYMAIRVLIPNRGKLLYSTDKTHMGKIQWEEHWENKKELAILREQEKKDIRSNMYQNFLREIARYQKETGASQGTIANISNISRKSINDYLSGTSIPKVSTMRKIGKSLGIYISTRGEQ